MAKNKKKQVDILPLSFLLRVVKPSGAVITDAAVEV
jgi:hypothetical protein